MSDQSYVNYMRSKGYSYIINNKAQKVDITTSNQGSHYGSLSYASAGSYAPPVGGALRIRGTIPLIVCINPDN